MTENAQERFEIKGPDARGTGMFVDNGFLVMKGAVARKTIAPSAGEAVSRVRDRLVSEGILVDASWRGDRDPGKQLSHEC